VELGKIQHCSIILKSTHHEKNNLNSYRFLLSSFSCCTARYCFFSGNFSIKTSSQETTLSSSNTATISFTIQFYDTTYWDYKIDLDHQVYEYDKPWQGVLNKTSTDWWQGGSTSTPSAGLYFPGDSITMSMNFNYDPNYLPYSYRALRIEIKDNANQMISVEKPFVYFTPYGTLKVWNYDDFLDLKRS
jgi:hypothetical protein